ncbi:aminoglycoside N(3)-acetyltransferase [Allorhizocola rhizosphaerae]|uniref:aminoglycoside N(3)-acetyltransferase n=1 Tax=Allorhizocola rhizosphaerae TaxID=1872709 RepID=UPI000E3BFCB4|nr:AAC(3) family N-acetyltransferase [Allorhizocola rhizosphaerae]
MDTTTELAGSPWTRGSLAAELAALGVRPGSVLLVHSSLKSLGWVCGGPVAVVQALLDALGPDGTLVVPTHTPDNSDPAAWQHPPVPESWWPVIREHMPAFDPAVTPSRWMGLISETVRTWPGARRSAHPQVSFAALGPAAEEVVAGHRLDDMLGESSPLGAVSRLDGDVLLLGVGHDSNTSLHLAEYRLPAPPRLRQGAAIFEDGRRAWVWWEDVDISEHDFERLGEDFDDTGAVAMGPVGAAACRLMRQHAAVDFAVGWFSKHRQTVTE